jgi:ubiquinone biosynthesis protein UbiJ
MTIVLALGVCLHLSWEISVVEDETRTLAEEAAILRTHIERLEARLDAELPQPSRTPTAIEPAPLDRA